MAEVNPPMTEPQRMEAVSLYQRGMTVRRVAAYMGRSYGSVHYWLKRAGVLRSRNHTNEMRRL